MDTEKVKNNLEWSHKHHNFDEVKIDTIQHATFTYYGDKDIKHLRTSCFCLSTRKTKFLDRTEIRVTWTIKPTPKINKRSKKTVDVIFENGDETTLTLEAIIKQ